MWLKEKEFSIQLGGQTFIDIPTLIQFNGESLFTVRRHEDTGEIGIDCDVYSEHGDKIASIRRNNMYPGDKASYVVDRSESHITLTDSKTGVVLASIKRRGAALPVELDVSLRTYLPDGRLLDLGPESSSIGGLFLKGNILQGGLIGVALNNPKLFHGRTFTKETVKVDGLNFTNCQFADCIFLFSGTEPFVLRGNTFSGSFGWEFEGAAALTVQVMTALYSSGFKSQIEGTIRAIRGEVPSAIQ